MSLVPQLIDRAQLPNAIALGSIPWQTGRMIGPSITGILIAAFGGTTGFGLAAVASCARWPSTAASGSGRTSKRAMDRDMLSQLIEGLRFVGTTSSRQA